MSEITLLLQSVKGGDAQAGARLYTLLYQDLRRLARSHLSRSGPITLDPSSLVHDAWLRCSGGEGAHSRAQFFAYASTVMRSVIVDQVRERAAQKRGGGEREVTLNTDVMEGVAAPDTLAMDDALRALERVDARSHQLIEMRFFGGMTLEEIAEVMDLSVPTLKRDWRRARAFLHEYLS